MKCRERKANWGVSAGAWTWRWLASVLLAVVALTPAAGQEGATLQEQYRLEEGDWRRVAEADPASPEGQLQAIHRALAQDEAKRAHSLAKQWIKKYPDHPMAVEAYLLRADALVGRKEYYKSLYDYEYVIRVYPASEQYYTALEREYSIARLFAAGMKRKWLGMRFMPAWGEAEEIFILIQERAPGSEVGEKASMSLGDFYFRRAMMANAAEAYDAFLMNYPTSKYREKAMLRLIQSQLATFKGPRFNAGQLEGAKRWLSIFSEEFPVSSDRLGSEALLLRIEESMALKTYYQARWYERIGERVSAVYLYRRLIQDRPQTVAAQAALHRLGELGQPVVDAESQAAEPAKPAEPMEPTEGS